MLIGRKYLSSTIRLWAVGARHNSKSTRDPFRVLKNGLNKKIKEPIASHSSQYDRLMAELGIDEDQEIDNSSPPSVSESTKTSRNMSSVDKEELKELIQLSKSKSVFSDLENRTLDLNKSNSKIVNFIRSRLQKRMNERLAVNSQRWLDLFYKEMGKVPSNKIKFKKDDPFESFKADIEYYFSKASISASKIGLPLTVGDLVILREGSTEFYIVISCPKSLDSNYYSLVNREGKVSFAVRPQIKFRIPSFIPKHYHKVIETMVILEHKTLDVAPIGVADRNGSKSKEALPEELRNKNNTSFDLRQNLESDDEFIANKLSSANLTNTDINTYIIPPVARGVFSDALTRISIDSMSNYKKLSLKFEVLHRILQYEDNGVILHSPRMVSIFQILYLIKNLKIPNKLSLFGEAEMIKARKQITKILDNSNGKDPKLGKSIYETSDIISKVERAPYDISLYFGVNLILRSQFRMWKINEIGLTNPVASVMILPLQNKISRDELAKELKEHHDQICSYIVEKIKNPETDATEPPIYRPTISLFKDFISGNINEDDELTVWCATLVRKIQSQVEIPGSFKYDYGKAKCYVILQHLGEFTLEDPTLWTYGMELGSIKADLNAEYYRKVEDLKYESKDLFDEDPVKELREPYKEPIFCIDSESAHEIDDGIGIKENSDNYVVTIHVANPSSYIRPDSELSQIALGYGFTTYLPQGPMKMLPDFISDISGLGTDNETRTFAIEFEVSKDFKTMKLEKIQQQMEETCTVKFYHTSNYPKGYTYKYVDKVLNGEVDDPYQQTLTTLYEVSQKLNEVRVKVGKAHEFQLSNSEVTVEYFPNDNQNELIIDEYGYRLRTRNMEISIGNVDKESKSTRLVTEMMIAGNHLTSHIGTKNNVPMIYRNQVLNLNQEIKTAIDEFDKSDFKSLKQLLQVMNAAKVDMYNKGHEALGLKSYGHVTSPLRRYSDLVNQWIFQKRANPQLLIDIELSNIINHLQARETINKSLSLKSRLFWQGIFLQEYFKLIETIKQEEQIKFDLNIEATLDNNAISINLKDFTQVKSILEFESSEQLFQALQNQINGDELEIKQVDFIENEIRFKYVHK